MQKPRTEFWAIVEKPTPRSPRRSTIAREFNSRLYIFTSKEKAQKECVGMEIVKKVRVNIVK